MTNDTTQTYWETLLATALVGTERRGSLPPAPGGPLGMLLSQLPTADVAGNLLSAAAATAFYQRAGAVQPTLGEDSVPPCELDDLPLCSPRAGEHLATMLSGTEEVVLPEWLELLAKAGQRVHNQHLPSLLNLGQSRIGLRSLLLPALGKRGRWLAAQNPAWEYASVQTGDGRPETGVSKTDVQNQTDNVAESPIANLQPLISTWETGSRAARLSLLRQLRAMQPELARSTLASTWAREKANERAEFLTTFAEGLSLDDEPFLEAALDDRSKEVRATAADLLSRLPDSGLAQRMVARALPLLTWHPASPANLLRLKSAKPAQIDVTLPDEADKAAQRDGIELKPPHTSMGERAWWLQQIIGRTPPDIWCAAWNADPATLVQAQLPKEWRGLLLQAWADAAIRYRAQPWIEALFEVALNNDRDINPGTLFAALPAARQEARLLEVLAAQPGPLHQKHPAFGLLNSYMQPWSEPLASLVLAGLHAYLDKIDDKNARLDWQFRDFLEDSARFIPPHMADAAAAAIPERVRQWSFWGDAIERYERLLHFRRDMLKEFAQ
ncbi:MAG: DUF5691 domain-containing protein [Chloroflexaceae bacterium]|nr:DUF5691 domain-containing protein [Chloroflexaceae bacterium]